MTDNNPHAGLVKRLRELASGFHVDAKNVNGVEFLRKWNIEKGQTLLDAADLIEVLAAPPFAGGTIESLSHAGVLRKIAIVLNDAAVHARTMAVRSDLEAKRRMCLVIARFLENLESPKDISKKL